MCPWAKGFQKNSGEREMSVGITGKRDVKREAWADVVNVHGETPAPIASAPAAFYRKEADIKKGRLLIELYEDHTHHRFCRIHWL